MKLELFFAPTACSMVPYVTLTEADAAFELRLVNLKKGEQRSADFQKLNPVQKVPVLMIDGKALTENVAIQLFIARAFPNAKLLPTDPFREVQAISFMAWCASGIHPFLSRRNTPARVAEVPEAAESIRRLAAESVQSSFRVANDRLEGRDFFFDEFTAPDAYFFWCYRRAKQLDIPVSQFANCERHFDGMMRRPSVQKFHKAESDAAAALAA